MKNSGKLKSVALASMILSANVSAAMILGFGVEADYLQMKADGVMTVNNSVTTFNSENQSAYQVGAFFEHPVPLVPNLRVDYTSDLTFSGLGQDVMMNQMDITPYYEILDNFVDIDVGITAKTIKGEMKGIAGGEFDAVIPMGYVGVGLVVPLVPVSFAGSVKYIGYDGDKVVDARAKLMYDIVGGFVVQAGYRYETIKLNDRFGMNANANFKGFFAGVGYTF